MCQGVSSLAPHPHWEDGILGTLVVKGILQAQCGLYVSVLVHSSPLAYSRSLDSLPPGKLVDCER
jgi:hypothetical protein